MPIKPENIGIYKITNQQTGMVYVGSSKTLKTRKGNHITYLQKGKHHNKKLQNAWDKYGESAFVFEILENCTIAELQQREQFWIDELNACNRHSGFNILPFAFRQIRLLGECKICGKTATPRTKGRCHSCSEYFNRHKTERPYKENAFKEAREAHYKAICLRCGRPVIVAGYAAKGLCKSCYRYFWQKRHDMNNARYNAHRRSTRRQTIAQGNLKIQFT